MTSLLDSEAQYLQRAAELEFQILRRSPSKGQGLATLNRYGFAHGQPRQPIDEAAFNAFFESIAGADQSLKTLSAARNLLFEAHVFISFASRTESRQLQLQPSLLPNFCRLKGPSSK